MHISLDSALGQQRRLNQVGETISSIAAPTAAYSLRSLTGGDPKVVRVRRGSDNHEQDFTASGVSSGALVDFVNAQVTAPLDIQELTATGRDGDFLIAKAAYSLRSLGTRQATVAATGDTVARADGKYVCQVRRSSDDALKSFTADEITDGTLLSFVGTSGSDNGFVKTWYDQSVTNQAGDTATGNHATQATAASQPKIVDAGSLLTKGLTFDGTDDFLRLTSTLGQTDVGSYFSVLELDTTNSSKAIVDNRDSSSDGSTLFHQTGSFRFKFLSTTETVASTSTSQLIASAFKTSSKTSLGINGAALEETASTSTISVSTLPTIGGRSFSSAANFMDGEIAEIIIYNTDESDNRTAIEANIGEHYGIDLPSGVDPGFDQVDGFVETWYDQSGNGNDAVQATAANQPKIVSAGSLVVDSSGVPELEFDGSNDVLSAGTGFASSSKTIFCVNNPDSLSSNGLFAFGSSQTDRFFAQYTSNLIRTEINGAQAGVSAATQKNLTTNLHTTDISVGLNGGSFTTTSASFNGVSASAELKIGQRFGTAFTDNFDGTIQEFIAYNSDQTANRTALETNINNHYSIF